MPSRTPSKDAGEDDWPAVPTEWCEEPDQLESHAEPHAFEGCRRGRLARGANRVVRGAGPARKSCRAARLRRMPARTTGPRCQQSGARSRTSSKVMPSRTPSKDAGEDDWPAVPTEWCEEPKPRSTAPPRLIHGVLPGLIDDSEDSTTD